MTFQNETELLKHIKEGKPLPVYLICGSEAHLKRIYLDKLIDMAVEGNRNDFSLHRFDGKETSVDAVSQAVYALPFLSARNCVVVTDLEYDRLSTGEKEKLGELLKDLPDSCVLIFYTASVVIDPKRPDKFRGLVTAVGKAGGIVQPGVRDRGELHRFLKSAAQKLGCTISTELCSYLVESCADKNLQTLDNEIHKLCAYVSGRAGEKEVTRADIDACVSETLDAKAYQLTDSLFRGNFKGAMEHLRVLLTQEEPVYILAILSLNYVDIYRALLARQQRGRTAEEELTKSFDYGGKAFRLRNALRDCQKFTLRSVKRSLNILKEADQRMKSTGIDSSLLLQETLVKLFVCREKG